MRAVDWGFAGAVILTVAAGVTVFAGSPRTAGGLAVSAVCLLAGLTAWSRRNPGPMPYACRWILAISPFATPRLKKILQPRPGERLLEIGPGLGHHAIAMAPELLPGGELTVADIQQEMLDAMMARVNASGVTNIVPRQADASRLPFESTTFDAAYLSAVLGEVPNRQAALNELHRVLKPGGRLIVAEILIDPDYVPLKRVIREAEAAGFHFDAKTGSWLAYAARFVRV